MRTVAFVWFVAMLLALAAGSAMGQQSPPSAVSSRPERLTLWDLPLGAHARELPRGAFADYACGTGGGPPSTPLTAWTDFGRCRAEAATGFHEVHFRYDDELEYRSRAIDPLGEDIFAFQGTTEFQIPVIVSGLFDNNGFLTGIRMATDPRTTIEVRERGVTLAGALRSLFGFDGWSCEDLPRDERETPYKNVHIKERCFKDLPAEGARVTIERHFYRKAGQVAVDPVTRMRTEGQFHSATIFQKVLVAPIANPSERLATLKEPPPTEIEILAARVRDCPGCDLRGVNLKRADLHDANLAGANLSEAVLHGADLTGANLAGAVLTYANLNRADFRNANVANADLSVTMMYGARFEGADLTNADIGSTLGARVQMTRAHAAGLRAVRADLRAARILEADLAGADFTESLLQDIQFARSRFPGAILSGALLWNTGLTGADLTRAVAVGADLTGADLRDADLSDADLTRAILTNAQLANVRRDGARFDDARLPAGFLR